MSVQFVPLPKFFFAMPFVIELQRAHIALLDVFVLLLLCALLAVRHYVRAAGDPMLHTPVDVSNSTQPAKTPVEHYRAIQLT
jgi:hypothetical protein